MNLLTGEAQRRTRVERAGKRAGTARGRMLLPFRGFHGDGPTKNARAWDFLPS